MGAMSSDEAFVIEMLAALASLADVIASKAAAGREKDLAVLPILEAALRVRESDVD